ncbi:hypothetical protein [Streptomyces sp. TLI_171]|uniref:hypothetical protein n=1 Tax=Streptomyces sp. TLI_171 TaxID=1938859 RepID=UPI000C19E188|nr:hypothetical protein [Streptomyces sp. TLI_171]RKE22679.1 hypothetical protein BX266_6126 [Streptomyces sp. TLI_171]
MARRVIRTAAVLLGSLLFAGFWTVAPAAAAQGTGTIVTSIGGVPAKVAPGDGFTATFTVVSTSRYRLLVRTLALTLTHDAAPDAAPDGLAVQWQDPATGAWQDSDTHGAGAWAFSPAEPVVIAPRGTLTYRARVTLEPAAASGAYLLETDGVAAYTLVDGTGRDVGLLDGHNRPQAGFRCLSAPGPSGTPAPTGSAGADPGPSATAGVPAGTEPAAASGLPIPAPPSEPPAPSFGIALALSPGEEETPDPEPATTAPSDPSRSPVVAAALDTGPGPYAAAQPRTASTLRLAFGVTAIVVGFAMGTALLVRRHAHPDA